MIGAREERVGRWFWLRGIFVGNKGIDAMIARRARGADGSKMTQSIRGRRYGRERRKGGKGAAAAAGGDRLFARAEKPPA